MQLYISSLNSGSNANCYYIGNDTDALLIDAGLSCGETEKRMKLLGLSMKKVKGVLFHMNTAITSMACSNYRRNFSCLFISQKPRLKTAIFLERLH